MESRIEVDRFAQRLENIQSHWLENKSKWGGADALCITLGATDESSVYSKSSSFHIYLFGLEDLTDSIIILTKNNFYFMSSPKKCTFLKTNLGEKVKNFNIHYIERTKSEATVKESFNKLLSAAKEQGKILGCLIKEKQAGSFVASWNAFLEESLVEKVEITPALSYLFAVKDDTEVDLVKRSSVFTNKVMKHGFLKEMENILDNDISITHSSLAKKIEDIINDPTPLGIKLPSDIIDSCYFPIIQSDGDYDLRISAVSNDKKLSPNVIIASLGARYKNYCANISRTFLIDPPSKIEKMYQTLLAVYNACLDEMHQGNEIKDVYNKAKQVLQKRDENLIAYLPKTLGFAIGIEFRDSSLLINNTNTTRFEPGMVFYLSIGLHNIPLTAADLSKSPESVKNLSTFSLNIGDMIIIQENGSPDILTKLSRDYGDISYSIAGTNEEESEDEGEEEEGEIKKEKKVKEEVGSSYDNQGLRRSTRSKEERLANENLAQQRVALQQNLLQKRIEEGKKRVLAGEINFSGNNESKLPKAVDIQTYKNESELPENLSNNKLYVDEEKESVLLPINGRHVPFHISTIKNVTKLDNDIRINFYIPHSAPGKEISKNMQSLLVKYGDKYTFIKELTFKKVGNSENLNSFYNKFNELRTAIKQKEIKAEQEKDLVVQDKLILIKNQRVASLNGVTLRPQLSGRKCIGMVEAHQNGIRFRSQKGEVLDILYSNMKHVIFQPCWKSTLVILHFHLKDYIIINKKKVKDVQFFTEVIESSLSLENTRSSGYDPDELDEEQREREMKRRLNNSYKDFAQKLETVAKHFNHNIQVDVPMKKFAFEGNCSREMVSIQPSTNCLLSITEWPPFLVTLDEIEHVHMERVNFGSKNFDLTIIFKDWNIPPRTITAVDSKSMDLIQDWLNMVEITCTKGPRSLNWTEIMSFVRDSINVFYDNKDEDGVTKPAGWLFLSAEDSDEEDEVEDGDSSFDEDSDAYSDEEDEDESDDESLADEDEESDEEEELDSDEEEGKTWEELEADAAADDRKRAHDRDRDSEKEHQRKKSRR